MSEFVLLDTDVASYLFKNNPAAKPFGRCLKVSDQAATSSTTHVNSSYLAARLSYVSPLHLHAQ